MEQLEVVRASIKREKGMLEYDTVIIRLKTHPCEKLTANIYHGSNKDFSQ